MPRMNPGPGFVRRGAVGPERDYLGRLLGYFCISQPTARCPGFPGAPLRIFSCHKIAYFNCEGKLHGVGCSRV